MFLKEIYKVGARKIAVFGAPPLGCIPYMRNHAGGELKTCVEDQNQAVQLYNTKLSSMLISLSHALPQSKVVYINIYNPLLNVIQNPHNYGKYNFLFIISISFVFFKLIFIKFNLKKEEERFLC